MKEYKVVSVDDKNNIDWDNVPVANVDIFKWTDNYKPETFAQVVLVKGYGLVAKLTCNESNPYTKCVEDGQDVHEDSCMEFFVSFDGINYINIEANSDAVKKIGFGPDRHDRRKVWLEYPGYFEVASFKGRNQWSLIEVLPFEGIKKLYPDFDENKLDEIKANFFHMGTNPNGPDYYYGMWNEVMSKNPDYHLPEYFGRLVF